MILKKIIIKSNINTRQFIIKMNFYNKYRKHLQLVWLSESM